MTSKSIHSLVIGLMALSCSAHSPPSAPPAAERTFSETLSQYGFVELTPPSTLLPPGTIVRLRTREPLQAQIVCTQKAALGPSVDLQSSSSQSTSLVSEAERAFNLDLSALPFLSSKAQYKSVGRVVMHLSNVAILEIPDTAVYEGYPQRSQACGRALADLESDPSNTVSMIKSVLAADVDYGIEFKDSSNLDVSAQVALVKALAADLGADASSAGEKSVQGHSLFWGVTDEIRLAQVGEIVADAPPAGDSGLPGSHMPSEPAHTPPFPAQEMAPAGARALPQAKGALAIDPHPLAE